jgi:EmrB/QacA subfamily drug resistance transporter
MIVVLTKRGASRLLNPVIASRAYVHRDSNALLLLVCLAQFMVILDVSIVNVALPAIQNGLGFSTAGLQWVVNAYTLTFAGFLLLGGRASDLLGRRRVFMAGTALFTAASLVCAIATSPAILLGARAIQGIGGAVISASSLAIITTSFEEGASRNRALGVWGALGGLGATSGVLLGGILTQGLGWPAIFVINVPIGIAVIVFGGRLIPEGRSALEHRHFDLSGALLVTAGMVAVVYGIVRSDVLSWGSVGVLGPIAVGALFLGAFGLVEGRFAKAPLMPLGIFRLRPLRSANAVILLLYSAIFAMWFFVSIYMQQDLHHDAIETGLAFLPMTLSVALAATLAPRLVRRVGARAVLTAGMLSAAAGLALLTGVRPGGTYLAPVLPGGLLSAFGLGLGLVPATIVAVQGVPAAQSGLASGLLNTSRLVGGALGLAVLTTIATSHAHARIAEGASPVLAQTDGYGLAFAVGAALCLLGAVAAAVLLRPQREAAPGELAEAHR